MGVFADGRALAIVNPTAGRGRARRRLEPLVALFRDAGGRVDVVLTAAAGDGARLAREAVEDGYGRIIAVGGDGTVNDVLNGIVDADVVLGVVPVGSANDFAAALGIRDWRAGASVAVRGDPRPVDLIMANGRAALNCVGLGVDAAGARVVESHKRYVGTTLGYVTAAVATLATFRPLPMRLEVDGEVIEGKQLLAVAANGERFANGMRIAPGASVDDGLVDVCVVGDTTVREAMVLLARVYRGAHVGQPKVRMLRARSLVIHQESPLPVQIDGELIRAERVEITCVPGAIRVAAP